MGRAALPPIDDDGTIHVPAFELPVSSLTSVSAREAPQRPNRLDKAVSAAIEAARKTKGQGFLQAFYDTPFYKKLRSEFPVVITEQRIGGVLVESFVPASGVAPENTDRVLINVHGGGFAGGSRLDSHLESVPIAAVGRIKVLSIDYRLGPKHTFPAASEDVAAVYRELIKEYSPEKIGIYGSSAGGVLTAQSVAWLMREKLPIPGAIGMFSGAGGYFWEGDSGSQMSALYGRPTSRKPPEEYEEYYKTGYLRNTMSSDPLVFPARSEFTLRRFPPSLLISSTRDQCLSSVIHTHSRLVANGVEAQLNVWEGLTHVFYNDCELQESREVYDVVVKFFARHLGTRAAANADPETDAPLLKLLGAEVERFVLADRALPPAPHQVLVIGSSSIVMWTTLAADLAPLPVLNRGFGGSQIEHVNRWFDKLVAPYQPRAIVFYAGENDIAAGKSVERVAADFDAFMARKTEALGAVPVYFISLKPSKLRFWQFKQQSEVNAAIKARAAQRPDLHYIDIVTPMLQDGRPRSLFIDDGLHMNPEGYAIWTQAVKAAVAGEMSPTNP